MEDVIMRLPPAVRKLNKMLDEKGGRLTYCKGQKVYGHRRLMQERRDTFAAGLREVYGTTEVIPVAEVVAIPSAERAGRYGRVACLTVAAIGLAAAVALRIAPNSLWGLVLASGVAITGAEGLGVL
jgi:hypothetical protein